MRYLVLTCLLLLCVAGCSQSAPEGYQPLPTAIDLKDFTLYDHNGDDVTKQSFLGQWSLVFFGFTYCPDICPTTLGELNKTARLLGEQSPSIVMLSVDPERDTPDQLKQYIEYFNPAFRAWSGESAQISNIAQQMHIYFEKRPLEESYTMDHSAQIVLVNPQGQYVGFFPPPHKPEVMAEAIRHIM